VKFSHSSTPECGRNLSSAHIQMNNAQITGPVESILSPLSPTGILDYIFHAWSMCLKCKPWEEDVVS